LAGHYYKDLRREQAENRFAEERGKKKEEYRPRKVDEFEERITNLVHVGGKKSKPELFKTNVLGLKDMKKSKLSFEEDVDI
jgi:hypothetical protein